MKNTKNKLRNKIIFTVLINICEPRFRKNINNLNTYLIIDTI